MMTLSELTSLEIWFDSEFRGDIPRPAGLSEHLHSICIQILKNFESQSWPEFFKLAEELFEHPHSGILGQGFALQFAVSACEQIYDMNLRKAWLQKWVAIESWASSPWLRYLRFYQDALTPLFAGHLREGHVRFCLALESAEAFSYLRGEMRCQFHLGVIAQERGLQHQARDLFSRAKQMSEKCGASRFEKRIHVRLHEVLGNNVDDEFAELERLLYQKDLKSAKSLALVLGRRRRSEQRMRGSDNLEIFLALLCFLEGKHRSAGMFLSVLDDGILKERYLVKKQLLMSLSSNEEIELKYLREILGIKAVQNDSRGGLEVLGVNLGTIANPDIAKFIQLIFSADNGTDKQQICQHVWGIPYDPVLHDSKVYRVIFQSRKILNQKDWIINKYGTYHLNPRLRDPGVAKAFVK